MPKKNANIFTTLGASNHCVDDRQEDDYYATDPRALELLLEKEKFNNRIWEPAAGGHHLANTLKNNGYDVITSDIKEYTCEHDFICNFLEANKAVYEIIQGEENKVDILTNPPYKQALDFVKNSLALVNDGCNVIMYLRIQFLEGKERYKFFQENPPKKIYVLSNRFACAKNGQFYETNSKGKETKIGSAISYAWFIWEKGYKGEPIIKWLIDHE